jgi:plastocyanin
VRGLLLGGAAETSDPRGIVASTWQDVRNLAPTSGVSMENTPEVPIMQRRTIAVVLVPFLLLVAALAAPLVVRAGGGCHGPVTPPGDGEASVVKIDGCMFYPTVARVPVGTTVRFLNTGTVPHNVTGVVGAWGSGELATGVEYRNTFSAPGVYPFACTLHPGMNGAIVVGDAAAAAAPAAPPALTTASQPTAAPAYPQAGAEATTTDWMPIVLAAVGGFGVGALGTVLASGALRSRRREAILPTAH